MLKDNLGADVKDIPMEKHGAADRPKETSPEESRSSLGDNVPERDHEEELREARELGLKVSDAPKKDANLRKRKRTPEQVFQDDLNRLNQEFELVVLGLENFLENKMHGQELGKLDRQLQKKIKDANDGHLYDQRDQLKKKHLQLEAIRVACKAVRALVGAASAPKKQAASAEFVARLRELRTHLPEALRKFPKQVQLSFLEACGLRLLVFDQRLS